MNFVYLQLQASERRIMFCAHDLRNKWKNSDILYQFLQAIDFHLMLSPCLLCAYFRKCYTQKMD